MVRLPILTAAALLVAALPCVSGTVYVDWTGAGDHQTIQEGVDAAAPGDTVLVAPGTYMGASNRNIHFNGKQVTLISSGGRRSTTINANNEDRVFNLVPSDGPDTVISGFTMMNGTKDIGGGIFCNGASVTVTDCHITSCTATHSSYGGGGVACDGGAPTFVDVTISGCQGQSGGGLAAYSGSTPTLTRVTFQSNTSYQRAGGAYIENPGGTFAITDCVFWNNNCTGHYGGGLYFFNASPSVTGCTFARNRGATAAHMIFTQDSDPVIENCVLAFSASGPPVFRWSEDQNPTFTRCIVYGNDENDDLFGAVSDTLNRDPLFCDVLGGDVALCSNSPCLPGGNPWGVQMGALESACGDCNAPVEVSTWGRLKALYR